MAEQSIAEIRAHLLASRERVLALTRELDGTQMLGPKLPTVSPPLWILGHIAWFQERWCLRPQDDGELADSLVRNADRLYDAGLASHGTRWTLPLLNLDATRSYLDAVLERTLARLEASNDNPRSRYFIEHAAHYEDLYAEALHVQRQTLAYVPPAFPPVTSPASTASTESTGAQAAAELQGDVILSGGTFMLGAYPQYGFVFDNEKWAHECPIASFAIARTPVTTAQYREFVEAGGYSRRSFWTGEGWAWLRTSHAIAPRYWRRFDGIWMERRFDRLIPLQADLPVVHVNSYEAEAYCNFRGRRLPTEAEWEYAATCTLSGADKTPYPWGEHAPGPLHANVESNDLIPVSALPSGDSSGGCRQLIGNVWEWTASVFRPYPGFVGDPFKEYSQSCFETHRVLRGGSFATSGRLIRNSFRYFSLPQRSDDFVGFRTCALG